MDYMESLQEFHKVFGHYTRANPTTDIPQEVKDLRKRLMIEELTGKGELIDSIDANDLVGIADGLADLLYVVFGTAVSYGIPMDRVFEIVHDANMAKLPDCEECKGSGGLGEGLYEFTTDDLTPLPYLTRINCTKCNGTGKGPSLKDAGGKTIKPMGWVGPENKIKELLGIAYESGAKSKIKEVGNENDYR